MKKQILAFAVSGFAVLMVSFSAHATPGDIACHGTTAAGEKIEVVKLYDFFQQNAPSGAVVTLNGKDVATFKSELKTGYVNVGTDENPFLNYQEIGRDGDDILTLRYPELPRRARDRD